MYVPSRIAPSFASGFARSPGESAAPELWPAHAWIPALGVQGVRLFDIAGGCHASVEDGATWSGNSVSIAASAHDIYAINPSDFKLRDYTIFVWADITSTPAFGGLISLVDGTNAYGLTIYKDNVTDQLRVYHNTNFTSFAVGSGSIMVGNNKRAAFTARGTDCRMYIDGAQYATMTHAVGALTDVQTRCHIAGLADGNNSMLGRYRAICLYRRALTPQEIAAISADPLLPFRLRKHAVGKAPAGGTTVGIAASIEGEGDVSGATSGIAGAAAAVVGEGEVSAQPSGIAGAAASVEGVGDVAGAASGIAGAAADVGGEGGISAQPSGIAGAAASVEGEGDVSGGLSGIVQGAATIGGEGSVDGAATGIAGAASTILGEGDVAGQPSGIAGAAASVQGEGDVTGQVSGIAPIHGDISGEGEVSGAVADVILPPEKYILLYAPMVDTLSLDAEMIDSILLQATMTDSIPLESPL